MSAETFCLPEMVSFDPGEALVALTYPSPFNTPSEDSGATDVTLPTG